MIVFLHGVPETADLWDGVRDAIGRPSEAWSLPGFGCPRPEGFAATKDSYAQWLVGELDKADEPVDLVGHDWGAGLALRVATAHGDKVRSWVGDIANVLHPDYVWHDFAKIWQTPGDGEAFFASQLELSVEDRAATLMIFGLDEAAATKLAGMGDETMSTCILDLYRSALPNPHADWGGENYKPTAAPGMILFPEQDMFADEGQARDVAGVLGARFEMLPGIGHFWPLQDPKAGAAALNGFWDSLD